APCAARLRAVASPCRERRCHRSHGRARHIGMAAGQSRCLTESCVPEAVIGPLPVMYPFIVSNPGEAAQAKRRLAAVTLGHLPPPLVGAGLSGDARELE